MRKALLCALVLTLALGMVSLVAAQDQVTLRVWTGSSSPAENDFKTAQFRAFEEANPGVTVEELISPDYGTQITAALASGDYPDVFTVGQFDFPSYLDSGVLLAAGDAIEAQDDIFPNLLAAFSDADGNAYCVPKDFSTLALFYNKDLFDAAGVAYPTADWTWADMTAAAEAITALGQTTDDGVGVVGFSAQADRNRWMSFLYGNGATVSNEDGTSAINSPEAVAALDFYASFVSGGTGAIPGDLGGAGWNGEAFGKGYAAMTVEGNWAIGYLQDQFPDLSWGVAEVPLSPAGTHGSLTFTECWAVGASTQHPEQAWALVNFLTGTEGAASVATAGFGVMPARASASEAWLATRGEEYAPFVNAAQYAIAPVFPLGYGDFTTAIDEGTTAVLTGEQTAQEMLDDAASVWNDIHAGM
ncbi:MAG: sugar ABC transporter substrate-binding protein [Anaerolineae bacterium]